jgi:hypothetical protein
VIDRTTILACLRKAGFSQLHETSKLLQFRSGNEVVYVKKAGTDHPLVIHGKHASKLKNFLSLPGVFRQKANVEPYHNAHMRAFDARQNRGMKPTRYGFDLGFESEQSLRDLLAKL